MSAAIKGKQISWGVASGAITAALVAATAGIVENYAITRGGGDDIIGDEDGDVVTRVDFGAENKIEMTVIATASSVVPAKGTELTGLSTLDGVTFGTGRTFVDDAKVTYESKGAKKIAISATHYPALVADA